MKPWMNILRELTWLTQLGLSLVMPPLLCGMGGLWLADAAGLGTWVMLPALALGLGGSGAAFWGFYRYVQRKNAKKDAGGAAFNDHT